MLRGRSRTSSLLCLCLLLSTLAPSVMTQTSEQDTAQLLQVEVLANISHDANAFTQGLLITDGRLFESTGRYGESTLREVDLSTGEVIRSVQLNQSYFGEGIARVGDSLIQLTWRENIALVWDLENLTQTGNFSYEGEGWGLCNDGTRLVMSNGSSRLTFRNLTSFIAEASLNVTLNGQPLDELNELECFDGMLYANVWNTDLIAVIDPDSGNVTRIIDAAGLLNASEAAAADVLNGIAHDGQDFWLTGKHWPKMFRVEFMPVVINGSNQNYTEDPFAGSNVTAPAPEPPARLGAWDAPSFAVLPLLAVAAVVWIIDIRLRRPKAAKGQGGLDVGQEGEGRVG